jgi:FkbM family methyltransferase
MIHPDSYIWRALEFYGTRIHHRGKWRIHNWLLNKLQVGCDRDFEVQRLGLRWLLNPSDFVQSSFYWTGEFETWDWFHLSRLIRPDSVVCDVGANFGFYSVMIGRQLVPPGRVFAFEPSAETLSRLRTNIRLNRLERVVTVMPIAISDRQGVGYLANAKPEYLGNARDNSGSRALSSEGEKISLDTLDHVCSEQKLTRVDLIKIDVEGHEMPVLEGATQTIRRFKPALVLECNDVALQNSGSSAEEMNDKLHSMGYRLFFPRRKQLVPFTSVPFTSPPGSIENIVNIFALPGNSQQPRL